MLLAPQLTACGRSPFLDPARASRRDSQLPWVVEFGRNHEHGAGSLPHDALSDRPEHPASQPAASVCADYEEVGVELRCQQGQALCRGVDDHVRDLSLRHQGPRH